MVAKNFTNNVQMQTIGQARPPHIDNAPPQQPYGANYDRELALKTVSGLIVKALASALLAYTPESLS